MVGIERNNRPRRLSRDFYKRTSISVAPDLLGCVVVRIHRGTMMAGKIVEVEAYKQSDPASHSYRGKTKRNEVMFREGGFLYVYFTYGMHYCANVVTGRAGRGEAVLIRAVEPLVGIERMVWNRYRRRRIRSPKELVELTSGPARFCQAFGIDKRMNGASLLEGQIYIVAKDRGISFHTGRSTRIGISVGNEKRWRWYVRGNEWFSGKR